MKWFRIDGARDYLADASGRRPSRKVIYNMVDNGLRTSPPKSESRRGQRFWFCAEWIDEYLIQRTEQPRWQGSARHRTSNEGEVPDRIPEDRQSTH